MALATQHGVEMPVNYGHVLLVTCIAPPRDPQSCTHGVYQRFAGLLRAAEAVASRVTVAAVYRTDESVVSVTGEELASYYRSFAGVSVDVVKLVIPPAAGPSATRLQQIIDGWRDPLEFDRVSLDAEMDPFEPLRSLLGRTPDIVIAHRLPALVTLLQAGVGDLRVALDLDDIEHKALFRTLLLPPHARWKLLKLPKVLGLMRLERAAVRRAGVTFVCSDQDRNWMGTLAGVGADLTVLPNAVTVPTAVSPVPRSANVLFVGALTYQPNADAVSWFIDRIWPGIAREMPDATLSIAGRGADRVPASRVGRPSVEFLGYVPDLEPVYSRAQLVICPIRAGGGTRIKIIEAAMHGRPVVSTPVGAEGLAFRRPMEIRLAKGATAFSQQCVELLKDHAQCQAIGEAAASRARDLYSSTSFVQRAAAALTMLEN